MHEKYPENLLILKFRSGPGNHKILLFHFRPRHMIFRDAAHFGEDPAIPLNENMSEREGQKC
ncbi:hypothetical protein TRIP_B200019 [uncultured Desulfatiglans sp.]|nr:hypothetical protein TRIP_B200019 [uncultured Desulfatiglans sp.]